ncbi:MAG: family 16 glycoside hydrolase [Planctomycetota bacterium]|nr:family 16 glycoside hydrolase [Planctomycetota bacterium]
MSNRVVERVAGAVAFGAAMLIAGATLGTAAEARELPSLTAEEKQGGWQLLFDGVSTAGWTTSGDPSAWAAKDGELVVVKPGKGWWLRTEKMYRDFELKLEFLVPPNGNSGVGLRGSSTGDPAFTGLEIQVFDHHGKPIADNVCGAVYGAIAPSTQACKPAGEWNSYVIRLMGDTLNVWLNGVQIHQDQKLDERGYVHSKDNPSPLRDRLPTGYISLQDHGDAVRYRNIKIRDRSADKDPGDFKALLNGKDLNASADMAGWTKRGGGSWTMQDGTLVGADGPGHLFHDATFTDLEFRAFVRINTKGNSGMYFRTVPRAEDPNTWPLGFEAQIDQHDPKNFTGSIYDLSWARGRTAPITRDNAWFDYRVRAVGDHVQTWVNGVGMVDARLPQFKAGHIALQTHHEGNRVEFRDLQVRDLSKGAGAGAGAGAAVGGVSAAPAVRVRQRKADEPIRVLYTTHSAGFVHPCLPLTREVMAKEGQERDWFDVEIVEDLGPLSDPSALAGKLAEVDVFMMFTSGDLPIDPETLEAWVKAGGGLVGVHSASDTFKDHAIFTPLIGGCFDGHPWDELVRIEVMIDERDPRFGVVSPLLAGAGEAQAGRARSFEIADEIYQHRGLNPANQVLTRLSPGQPKMDPAREYPLSWTRDVGQGRVFYTALGHRPEVWRDQRFVGHVLAGLRWAGGK